VRGRRRVQMLTGGALAVTAVVATLALPRTGLATPARLEAGDHGRAVLELQQELVGLRFLPPRAATGRFGPETADAVIDFQATDGATRINASVAGRPSGAMRLMQPMIARTTQQNLDRGYARLKRLLETGTPT
jgi:peptidoglycan hydrolase-like protein with peptidoglycan-binding domain